MRWPWSRREPDIDEAQAHLDRIKRQQPEVTRLTSELQAARERNHFAEIFLLALRGRQGGEPRGAR